MPSPRIESLVEENLALRRRLRDGEGGPCTKPWVGLEERGSRGNVKPCCWYRGQPQGVIRDGADVLAIWNGAPYRALRQAMRVAAPKECQPTCPLLTTRQRWFDKVEIHDYAREELASFDVDFLANRAAVLRAILAGDDDLNGLHPLRIHLHPSDVCNLRCVMCYLDLDSGRRRDWYAGPHLPALIPYLEEFKVFGGEPFFCETSRTLILDTQRPRWTHTSFVTNATLVTARVIEGLQAVRIGSVDVSLDAATRESYEAIRLRGNFDKAVAGARRLADLSRRHPIRAFTVYADFVIQERNYRELVLFVALCADLGLVPNFTACGVTAESTGRAERQGTEVGVPPRDRDDLWRHLDAGQERAAALRQDFAVESLSRVREEFASTPG